LSTSGVCLNDTFWSQEQNAFAFAIDNDDKLVPVTSVLSTVPMWFGLLDEAKAESTITQLAAPDHQADWGMRIISKENPKYGPDGYHYGAGVAVVYGLGGDGGIPLPRTFRRMRTFARMPCWRSTDLWDTSRRFFPAITINLSSPVLRTDLVGGDGGEPLAGVGCWDWTWMRLAVTFLFAPHVPAGWNSFSISNLRMGESELRLNTHERQTPSHWSPRASVLETASWISLRH